MTRPLIKRAGGAGEAGEAGGDEGEELIINTQYLKSKVAQSDLTIHNGG